MVDSGREGGVAFSAADIGVAAAAWVFLVGEDANRSRSNVELDKDN
jgi:hypothetical protein